MKEDYFRYQAQTSPYPLALQVSSAKGCYIYDTEGKEYLDLIAGVSACPLGHCHPKVVEAIRLQASQYMHVMVYGEFIQQPAVQYAKLLASLLPDPLETTYMVNSGAEAMEGALKLARKATGRSQIIAAKNAYHGNTMGSLSLMGLEERKAPFRPLIPDVSFIGYNSTEDLKKITEKTACVVLETIQGGAGFLLPQDEYLQKVKARCKKVGALLILDEIQPGFGRTGALFAFEHYNCIPDILVIGKGMAAGLPVGAFTASKELMSHLKENPKLGHITTFGGNAVIAAACLATLNEITSGSLIADTLEKEKQFRNRLQHSLIKELRGKGLMLGMIVESEEIANKIVIKCAQKGVLLFWLLFEPCAVRITPPLTISKGEIDKGCDIILQVLTEIEQ